MPRELGELGTDLIKREPHFLGKHDKRDASDDRARVPAMAGGVALGVNELLFLVEPQGGGCHATTLGNLANRQYIAPIGCGPHTHSPSLPQFPLDFKCT
jgi:hypothetical protein